MLKNENNLTRIGSVLTIIIWLVAAWFLVHLLAVFGLFLAAAYPILWLFAPRQTICFLCRMKKAGEYCLLCQKQLNDADDTSPKNLLSLLYNGLLIIVFTTVAFGLVFVESKVLFKMGFPPTPKTVSFVIPEKGQYRLDEVFPLKIEIVGVKTPINAIQADLSFDPNRLELVDISTEESFATIFIQKELNNEVGYGRITGGLPNPGFFSDRGVFATAFFKGKTPGVARIEFLPTSMILANDSHGTNTLKDLASVSYLILPERVPPNEIELQNSIQIESTVLGESTTNSQMKFYEENRVLGATTNQDIQSSKKTKLIPVLLSGLETVDRFILDLWGKIRL